MNKIELRATKAAEEENAIFRRWYYKQYLNDVLEHGKDNKNSDSSSGSDL
jgi:hypothetical protein